MHARLVPRFLGVAVLTTWALLGAFVPSASAEPCPDIEVVFARGTFEPPGVGKTGQAFVDSLGSKVGARSFGVYPVDYPASINFPTAVDGVSDAINHVESTAANCPKTRMVLGGYSQGAAVMGFVTSPAVPAGLDPADAPRPMPPEVADHIAAVTLFGTPNQGFMDRIHQPPVAIGPLYAAKTIELCAADDPVCASGLNRAAHSQYVANGMADQGADFAARHL
jgi:cutinase